MSAAMIAEDDTTVSTVGGDFYHGARVEEMCIDSEEDASITTSGSLDTADTGAALRKQPCIMKGRTWDQYFEALKAFKMEKGHANVPYYHKDRALGEFVNKCRKNPSAMTWSQCAKLDSIGFDWSSTQERLCKLRSSIRLQVGEEMHHLHRRFSHTRTSTILLPL
ncbi:MAG: helicase associated domain-containing protein [Planctomycetota bacterium]